MDRETRISFSQWFEPVCGNFVGPSARGCFSNIELRCAAIVLPADQQIRPVPVGARRRSVDGMRKCIRGERLQSGTESSLKLNLKCIVVGACRISDKPRVEERGVRI